MHGLLQTLRHTIRLLLKSPGFTFTAVIVLGFGIGINTAIFSLIDTVLLTPLPYPKSERLVQISMPIQGNPWMNLDYPDYSDLSAAQQSFESLSVMCRDYMDLTGSGRPERLYVSYVSASIFKVTDLPFVLGRPFTEKEDVPNGPLLVVLSERFWRSRFNANPDIIGKNLVLSEHTFQVVGVVPAIADDWGPPSIDVYLPLNVMSVYGYNLVQRDQHSLMCLGRLKEGVTLDKVRSDLEVNYKSLCSRYPETHKGYGIRAVPLLQSAVGDYSITLWLLGACVACLLLISAANVANLLFVRWFQRRKEMTIRAAIGASRFSVAGELLLEAGFLSLLGGLFGLFISFWGVRAIRAFNPGDRFRFQDVSLDVHAILFVFGLTVLVALLSGFLPAWNLSRTNLASSLREQGDRAGTAGVPQRRTQSMLMIGQIALTSALLLGAGLLIRSFWAEKAVSLGFNPVNLLTAEIYPTSTKYVDLVLARAFFDAVLEKVRRLPGVIEAAMDEDLPFNWDWNYADPFKVPGKPEPEAGREPRLDTQRVSPNFFRTLEIPLIAGRDFNAHDKADSERVVIIDEALARRFFASENPIGKQIYDLGTMDDQKPSTIVGVAGHVLHHAPGHDQAPFQAYYPYSQRRIGYEVLVVRSLRSPQDLAAAIREQVASVDPDVPVPKITTLGDLIAQKFAQARMGVLLITVFSGAALFLAAVGLYGVLSYSVSQRTRDIGIRMAIGANSWAILSLIVKDGFRILAIGLIVGTVTGLVLARFIESILYGVSGSDPISVCAAVIVLGLAALVACLLPALRAARINPITALRE